MQEPLGRMHVDLQLQAWQLELGPWPNARASAGEGTAGMVIFGCHALLADSTLCLSFLSCPRCRLSDLLIKCFSLRSFSHRVRTKPWSPLLLFLSHKLCAPSRPRLAICSFPCPLWVRFHIPAEVLVSSYLAWWPLTLLATLHPWPPVAAHTLGVTPVTTHASCASSARDR